MTIDLKGALRRYKPERRRSRLALRARRERLTAGVAPGRAALVPDTNVYIMVAAGLLPSDVQWLIERALLFHCSVCLGELATGVANADPSRPGWKTLRAHYTALFDTIPTSRLLTPDSQTWTEAGVVAGLLARTQGFQRHQRKECLNDALIYLTAAKAGLPVLTSNADEFDLIEQVAPEGAFISF